MQDVLIGVSAVLLAPIVGIFMVKYIVWLGVKAGLIQEQRPF